MAPVKYRRGPNLSLRRAVTGEIRSTGDLLYYPNDLEKRTAKIPAYMTRANTLKILLLNPLLTNFQVVVEARRLGIKISERSVLTYRRELGFDRLRELQKLPLPISYNIKPLLREVRADAYMYRLKGYNLEEISKRFESSDYRNYRLDILSNDFLEIRTKLLSKIVKEILLIKELTRKDYTDCLKLANEALSFVSQHTKNPRGNPAVFLTLVYCNIHLAISKYAQNKNR